MRDAGALPNLERLRCNGASGVLESTIPTNSASAWVSFMTGKNPGKHGVYEFQVQPEPGSPRRITANSRCIPGESIWQILDRHGLTQVTVNVPITYPPTPVKGVMVSGIPIPSGATIMTPEDLEDDVRREVGEYIVGTQWRSYINRPKQFLDSLTESTRYRAKLMRYLLDRYEPDVATVVFVGPDRLQHCLWHYLDADHLLYDEKLAAAERPAITAYLHELDKAVGEVLEGIDENVPVLVVSDHGFQSSQTQLALNEWLETQGLLHYRKSGVGALMEPLRGISNPVFWRLRRWYRGRVSEDVRKHIGKRGIDWSRTKAYAPWGHQEGISINLKGREPEGTVQQDEEYEELRESLKTALLEMRVPGSDRPVVRNIMERESFYNGTYVDLAADLILIAEDGIGVAPPPHPRMLWRSTGWSSGGHDLDGILMARWPGIKKGGLVARPQITDIAPTMLYLLGLPIPSDMDGEVIRGLFDEEDLVIRPPEYEEPHEPSGSGPSGFSIFSEDEEKDLAEKLRGLGYLS
jgi:predicted AlkP superfamily phosphohydrolase/phosphomutase